ncbi:MAG: hypothetical protein EHM58_05735 [Ignavibacteriae bacterium]|nr:MAG: hypothetical protein EHM58_05735 [Ignavibacteriota bacterium]
MDNITTRPVLSTITEQEIADGKMMGILAYIIFLVPLLAARENKFAMFHTEQSIILLVVFFVFYIAIWILTFIIGQISSTLACGISILMIVPWILYLVLWIMGIINAAGGKVKELPIVGKYGSKLNLVK